MKLHALLPAIVILVFALIGCDGTPGPLGPSAGATEGTISGQVSIDPDLQGTPAYARVELFSSLNDANCCNAGCVTIADENGLFEFPKVCYGTYYLGAWKDNDGNSIVSAGDFTCDRTNIAQNCCVVRDGNGVTVSLTLSVVQ